MNKEKQKAWRGMNINVNLIARYGSRSVGWGLHIDEGNFYICGCLNNEFHTRVL